MLMMTREASSGAVRGGVRAHDDDDEGGFIRRGL